jgi:hypothetical protein
VWAIRGRAKKEAKNSHAYGSLLNSLYFCTVSWFFKKPSVSDKKQDGGMGEKKERNKMLRRKFGRKEPASSDSVRNKGCALRR